MMKKINYSETEAFKKDLKQLLKRFKTLESDLEVVKQNVIELYHIGRPDDSGILRKIDNRSTFPISGFCTAEIQICKIKKFACKALKGRGARSGIRVIYAFHITACVIEFIEIYFKSDQPNEDRNRIKDYLKKIE